MSKCVWIGIGVEIKEETSLYKECLKINRLLSDEYGAQINFSDNQVPHLNIYDLSIPEENISSVTNVLATIVDSLRKFSIKINMVGHFPFGLFFLEIENNNILKSLHAQIVNAVNPLREDCVDPDYLQPHRKYTNQQKEYLDQYGNPHVLELFKPHITLGHIKRRTDLDFIEKKLGPIQIIREFEVNNVTLVTEDALGKNKTLMRFDLKP